MARITGAKALKGVSDPLSKMDFNVAIFLAALGITTLEFVEAAAVGLALFMDSKSYMAFVSVALGSTAVLIPTVVLGSLIGRLPSLYVRLVGGVLLLYFGIRLTKSARRAVLNFRKGNATLEAFEKGLFATGASVGAVEAFEAAVVLVGLLPNSFESTILGMGIGIAVVIISTYVLRSQVRKVKQANMKVVVAALLLSFSVFWFGEAFIEQITDIVLIPLFALMAFLVYRFANRPSPRPEVVAEVRS